MFYKQLFNLNEILNLERQWLYDIDNEDNMTENIDDNEYPEYPNDKCE